MAHACMVDEDLRAETSAKKVVMGRRRKKGEKTPPEILFDLQLWDTSAIRLNLLEKVMASPTNSDPSLDLGMTV